MDGTTVTGTKDVGDFCLSHDNTESYYIKSYVPESCKTEACILGIDEAGRGPVLGPMVYSICYCLKNKEEELKLTGCADSKSLTEVKREVIFDKLCGLKDFVGWDTEVISPTVISNSMLRRQKISLNEISHNAAINLVKRAQESGVKVTDVFVDTVGPAGKYQAKLKDIFPELNITVANKADATYPIVSAASIFAKVTRDICLKVWKCPEFLEGTDINLGSGYPGDPDTKKFLEENIDPVFGFPQVVRFSWATALKILEAKAAPIKWEDDELPSGSKSIKSFFKKPEVKERHQFFRDRNLTNTTEL
ncbi:hypothetical protein AAG570_000192 [Ranatra chinensis]|uniref:Ribonuclease n=1 Tax=Ranatra chinensis TaxID=642074 RepID=A0ABD0YWM7_9HEMI